MWPAANKEFIFPGGKRRRINFTKMCVVFFTSGKYISDLIPVSRIFEK